MFLKSGRQDKVSDDLQNGCFSTMEASCCSSQSPVVHRVVSRSPLWLLLSRELCFIIYEPYMSAHYVCAHGFQDPDGRQRKDIDWQTVTLNNWNWNWIIWDQTDFTYHVWLLHTCDYYVSLLLFSSFCGLPMAILL